MSLPLPLQLLANRPPPHRDWSVGRTGLENAVISDPDWIAGGDYGKPRPGHPEGAVSAHLLEVFANVDMVALDRNDNNRLRFVALVHDHFKYQVDRSRDRVGENHHGMLARRFAESYTYDTALLDVVELHDEAFNSWKKGSNSGKWDKAEARAAKLIDRLGESLDFYLRFYAADISTGSKEPPPYVWFWNLAKHEDIRLHIDGCTLHDSHEGPCDV